MPKLRPKSHSHRYNINRLEWFRFICKTRNANRMHISIDQEFVDKFKSLRG